MARRFQNIPQGADAAPTLRALVDVVQYITAQTQTRIEPLAPSASNADVIAKVNEIISRLQGT